MVSHIDFNSYEIDLYLSGILIPQIPLNKNPVSSSTLISPSLKEFQIFFLSSSKLKHSVIIGYNCKKTPFLLSGWTPPNIYIII